VQSTRELLFRDGADKLSRMSVVKQLFHAFINRSQAYDFANHIGLILFGSRVDLACGLTPLYERFRNRIDEVEEEGDTKLWHAINLGATTLREWQQDHAKAATRIVVITDGADKLNLIRQTRAQTSSAALAAAAAAA